MIKIVENNQTLPMETIDYIYNNLKRFGYRKTGLPNKESVIYYKKNFRKSRTYGKIFYVVLYAFQEKSGFFEFSFVVSVYEPISVPQSDLIYNHIRKLLHSFRIMGVNRKYDTKEGRVTFGREKYKLWNVTDRNHPDLQLLDKSFRFVRDLDIFLDHLSSKQSKL